MAKKKIELFTAGCSVCKETENMIREIIGNKNEIIIYNLNSQENNTESINKAEEYKIKSLPAVAVDGKLLSCCENRSVSREVFINSID